jgi:hypothetical protein
LGLESFLQFKQLNPEETWVLKLLLFAIMLAMLAFWVQIKDLQTRCRKPHTLVSSGHKY